MIGLHYHSGLEEFIFHPVSFQPSVPYSGQLPGIAATLSIADRRKSEKPPPCQKGVMALNH